MTARGRHRRVRAGARGRTGAVRRLELLVSPLESMFFALTTDDAVELDELAPHELAERVLAGT